MLRRHHKKHDEHMDESWLIPYADLLTLLLALFIMLFAASTIDAQKYNALREALNAAFQGGTIGIMDQEAPDIVEFEVPATDQDLRDLQKQLDSYIEENNLDMVLTTSLQDHSLTLTIRDHVMFDSGSAVVRPEFIYVIHEISNIVQEFPAYNIVVSGHTDNVPINNSEFQSNWDLSSARALNFLKLLLQNENVGAERFSMAGYGEYRPVAPNDTAEGRTLNRRVEVNFRGQH
ncbi:MAG: flagellar motor protein MotB [Bacillota bacterium]|jgi:chemotaxis protein MotB